MGHPFLYAVLIAGGLLGVGLALRATVRWLQVLYIPASVVAGLLGLALVQAGLRAGATAEFTKAVSAELSGWPGWLIAVVFAGLLLERPNDKGLAQAIRQGARSGMLAWIIILGQIVIGLLVYLAIVRPAAGGAAVPASFGQLLEVSWAGGHGTSAAMGQVYASLGFAEGKDLAFFLATVGLIYGVLSGLVLVNLAVRNGWTHAGRDSGPIPIVTGLEPRHTSPPMAFRKTRGEVMDPLALQAVILLAAFGAGYLLQQGFIWGAGRALAAAGTEAAAKGTQFLSNIPLFLFTLIGGRVVRQGMSLLRLDDLIDRASIQRLLGVSVEFLIVAAVSTMRLESLKTYWLATTLLVALAAIWCTVCLLVLAPRLLPRGYWFELGLLNYGFATANTPQGLMLLRIIDPELKTGAAEDYAVAAPLSAPFVGGGVITIVVMPLLLERVPAGWVAAVLVGAIVCLYWAGRRMGKER